MKKIRRLLVFSIIVGIIYWFVHSKVDHGYVASASDGSVYVVELDNKMAHGRTKEEIAAIVNSEAYKMEGTYYYMPFINKILRTNFEPGEKVRVYWDGITQESLPPSAHASLITK